MSYLKIRNDFFKSLCEANKKVAHGRTDIATGDIRQSFFSLNNEEEALAGMVQKAHLPCVIHTGYYARPILKDDSERVILTNELTFLAKPAGNLASDITAAWEEAENVLIEFIQWMLNEYEETGSCGPFKEIELNMFSWDPIGPVLHDLYGFELTVREEHAGTALVNFQPNNWY